MIEEPEEPEGGDEEDTSDEITASRRMGRNTMMVTLEEQRAETERERIKAEAVETQAKLEADVETKRIESDERKALNRQRMIITAVVLALLGGSMGLYVNLDVLTGTVEVSPTTPAEEAAP